MGDEEVKSEVEEMNKSFKSETADEVEIKPDVEEVIEKEVVDEPESEPDTDEETKEGETPLDDEGGTEPEGETEPEEDERDKVIVELRKKLDEKEAVKEPEPVPEQPIQFEPQEFVGEDEDVEDIINNRESLNKVLNTVYQRAVTDTRKVLGEGVLRSIPDIVRASVDIMDKLKKMNDKFYSDNSDLKPFNKVVAAVFEEVATENPGKDMMDLLPMVANESRRRLELHKQAVQTPDRKSPRLPRRKQRTMISEDKPNPNPLLNELEEMSKTLRR